MSERTKKLEEIFHIASELATPEQREKFLKEACLGEADLRREVEALLKSAPAGDELFQPSERSSLHSGGVFIGPVIEQAGTVIGRYKLLEKIGEEGDFNSKMRESLVSIGRMVAFMQAIVDQTRQTKDMKDNRARIKVLQRDIQSLTDHASFLNGKISFLLDAVLGMSAIEQNGIIKIFSVAAVVFLPPTLVASIYGMNFKFMPELEWYLGYPVAIGLMILSALLPWLYFKQKGWL